MEKTKMINEEQRKKLYNRVYKENGTTNQIIKAIEEMSELTKELCKFIARGEKIDYKNIIDEIADVKIIVEQLETHFDVRGDLVDLVVAFKLNRLDKMFLPSIIKNNKEEESSSLIEKLYDEIDKEENL